MAIYFDRRDCDWLFRWVEALIVCNYTYPTDWHHRINYCKGIVHLTKVYRILELVYNDVMWSHILKLVYLMDG